MPHDAPPPVSILKVLLTLGLFVIVGIPMVAYLWETLNQVLSGQIEARRMLLSLPMLLAFGVLLFLLARNLNKL